MARAFGRQRPSSGDELVLKQREGQETRNTQHRPLAKPWKQPPYRLDLADVVKGSTFVKTYPQHPDTLVFQLSGDTGNAPNANNRDQLNVVDGMESQFANDPIYNPAFFYSCGDCVYFNGQDAQYYAQFYEPYEHYPGPVFAIPGNHDGENLQGESSLAGFIKNFCALRALHRPEAGDIPRDAMTQPYVYWTLLAPHARIIGLYTNVEPGGDLDDAQYEWLVEELTAAKEDEGRAVILTMHHPIYSLDNFHSGSPHVQEPVMKAIAASRRYPDLVVAAHVHNMQRFSVPIKGEKAIVPYLVAGAGGYSNLHKMQKSVKATSTPIVVPDKEYGVDVTLESYVNDQHGFFRFEVSASMIVGEYFNVPRPQDPYARGPRLYDRFTYDWRKHAYVANAVVSRYPGTGYR